MHWETRASADGTQRLNTSHILVDIHCLLMTRKNENSSLPITLLLAPGAQRHGTILWPLGCDTRTNTFSPLMVEVF